MLLLLAYLGLAYTVSSGVIHLNRGASNMITNDQIFIVLHCEDICKHKCLGKCLKSTSFHHHRSCNGESNPIKSINVTHFEDANSTNISATITVTLYKETVANYVLFVEYRTQTNKNRWTLLEVILGESVFEVHNLNANIPYQLRLSYSIAWQTPCGESALSNWINLTPSSTNKR